MTETPNETLSGVCLGDVPRNSSPCWPPLGTIFLIVDSLDGCTARPAATDILVNSIAVTG